MRNRLAAVLLVGVTGYGCGAIFALHGAPDLALTQFLVETLTLVFFVLVLRVPRRGRRRHAAGRLPRAVLAVAVGASITGLAAFAMAARTPSRSQPAARRRLSARSRRQHRQRHPGRHPRVGHPRRDLGAGGGCHRGGLAGVPAPALRRGAARPDAGGQPETTSNMPYSPAVGDITWLRGSEYRDPRYRSLVLEVATASSSR
jgi:multicomponent Na+:H+ antiporter subunit A